MFNKKNTHDTYLQDKHNLFFFLGLATQGLDLVQILNRYNNLFTHFKKFTKMNPQKI